MIVDKITGRHGSRGALASHVIQTSREMVTVAFTQVSCRIQPSCFTDIYQNHPRDGNAIKRIQLNTRQPQAPLTGNNPLCVMQYPQRLVFVSSPKNGGQCENGQTTSSKNRFLLPRREGDISERKTVHKHLSSRRSLQFAGLTCDKATNVADPDTLGRVVRLWLLTRRKIQ
ncbi:hypothetical protein CPSG_02974 [Coccidioides posadasii str. Silveira]|uniref:Uncharacterized protein n=1 Tax=Coccidioides posadasii (strain RMSCC 757 / Silveira) TaxID=443226 RepID=E9CYV4_COCPS|nr:hypothetical protein CPSG_02974 [Coccidioides posadasii str. Silveira]